MFGAVCMADAWFVILAGAIKFVIAVRGSGAVKESGMILPVRRPADLERM